MKKLSSPVLKAYLLSDYIITAMLAAIGLASKAAVVPLAHLVSGPLFIPGGVLAGGFYMMFLVLATCLIRKRGAAFLVALIQAVLVTISGSMGSHGIASLFTYTASGLAVELWFLLLRHRGCCRICCFGAGVVANLAGTLAVNLTIFNLPLIPLLLSLSVATLSGGLGGLAAYKVGCGINALKILDEQAVNSKGVEK